MNELDEILIKNKLLEKSFNNSYLNCKNKCSCGFKKCKVHI